MKYLQTLSLNIVPQSSICFGFGDVTLAASDSSLMPFAPTATIIGVRRRLASLWR